MMYDWLTQEERVQFHNELIQEEIYNLEDLRPMQRFFRLLHFIYVKYFRVKKWVGEILRFVEDFNSKALTDNFFIKDLMFVDSNQEKVSLFQCWDELQRRTKDLPVTFRSFLKYLDLEKECKIYLESLKRMREEWE